MFKGNINRGSLWSIVLTTEEIMLLASGVHPLFIKPEAMKHLIAYWPLTEVEENEATRDGHEKTPDDQ